MRADGKRALVLALIAATSACGSSHTPCGDGGTFLSDDEADYCVYAKEALPIVIEGGFACPAAMQFDLDLGAHRVCSDRALDPARLPRELCVGVQGVCSMEAAPMQPESPPQAESEPAPSTPPDAGAVAIESPAGTEWTECNHDVILEQGLTGDRCPAEPAFGCGTSDECSATFALCAPGDILKVSDLDVLDCPQDTAAEPDAAPPLWSGVTGCQAALQDGQSFQPCESPFVCARRTEDPCCIEYAVCNEQGPLPTNVLVRYRFCERACTRVEPNPDLEPVTACSYYTGGWPEGVEREEFTLADLPCEGDLICWADRDLSSVGSDAPLAQGGVLRWCSEGVMRGQHSTASNVFIPDPRQ